MPPTRRTSSPSAASAQAAPQPSAAPVAAPAPSPGAYSPPRYAIRTDGPGGLDKLLNTEWVLTNGLGGFAMGSCAGVPSRRYHALLIAAAAPPVGRVAVLNALVETLDVQPAEKGPAPAASFELATFRFCGQPPLLHPSGISRLKSFSQDLSATWTYEVREPGVAVEVVKHVQLPERANAVQVRYAVRRFPGDSGRALRLRLRPLTSLRDFHSLIRRSWADRFTVVASSSEARVRFEGQATQMHLRAERASFAQDPQWWNDFFYQADAERGQDCVEDLFSPGEFSLGVPATTKEATCILQASIAPVAMIDAERDRNARTDRLAAMHAAALANRANNATQASTADIAVLGELVTASDAFVVARRSPGGGGELTQTSVIAGYPWFADWGRDTSISLPGLLLCTGRLEDAKRTLLAFASHRRNGIVPNVFHDQTGEPEYNTVDASLWFILGACAFRRAGGDRATWDGLLAPACLDIISHYRRGTDFNIAMDPLDKLITAGTNATQLTWMDARRDGVTFTPRHGKAVEINALWHAALRELSLAMHQADSILSANLNDLAGVVAASFRGAFWNAKLGCLHDTLTPREGGPGWVAQPDIRPNQLFAVSLPHSPLTTEQQRSVLACVRERLLTPYGVRTLDPADPRFIGRYEGNLFERDRAYHNGTAWPWLLGPYAEAVLRVGGFSDQARKEARAALQPILAEMHGVPTRSGPCGCIGQIAEIYDGGAPQRPQGCPAQAWSIAEALRVMCLIA